MESIRHAVSAIPKDEAGKAVLADFIKGIRENLQRTEELLTKTTGLLLSLAIVCELLNQVTVSEFSIFGVKLTNLILVRKLIPVAIAYLFNSHSSLLALRRLLLECLFHSVQAAQPQIFHNGLWSFLNPPSTFEIQSIFVARANRLLKRAMSNLSLLLMIAVAFGPILYLIYAYLQLFYSFGLADLLLWLSAITSACLTMQGFLMFVGINVIVSD